MHVDRDLWKSLLMRLLQLCGSFNVPAFLGFSGNKFAYIEVIYWLILSALDVT